MIRTLAALAGRRRTLLVTLALAGVVLTAVPTQVYAQADPASVAAQRVAIIAENVVRIVAVVLMIGAGFMLWTAHGGVVGPLIGIAVAFLVILNPRFWLNLLTF